MRAAVVGAPMGKDGMERTKARGVREVGTECGQGKGRHHRAARNVCLGVYLLAVAAGIRCWEAGGVCDVLQGVGPKESIVLGYKVRIWTEE